MNADHTTSGDFLESFALPQQSPIFLASWHLGVLASWRLGVLASWRLGVRLSSQKNRKLKDSDTERQREYCSLRVLDATNPQLLVLSTSFGCRSPRALSRWARWFPLSRTRGRGLG
jgi:hypothetical protein